MQGLRRLALGLSLAVAVWPATPAEAGAGSRAWTDGAGIGSEAETSRSPPSQSSDGAATAKPVCTYNVLTPGEADVAESMADSGIGPPRGDGDGTWYRKICTEDGRSSATIVWGASVDTEALARRALNYTPLPAPRIGMNPPPERDQLVNLRTWLWVEDSTWGSRSADASVPGVTVTVTAQAERVVWDMGNGDEVVCVGPGTPYDARKPEGAQDTDCSYTYRHGSAGQPDDRFVITATVEWRATWSAEGAPGGGDLGLVRRSASVAVRVAEAQALNQ